MFVEQFYQSNLNVLSRYYFCAKAFNLENIVRLTADCPLIDPNVLDNFASFYKNNNYDYVSNTIDPTYPDGMDIEIFSPSDSQLKVIELEIVVVASTLK